MVDQSKIDALLPSDSWRWNYGSATGTPVTVTYSFVKAAAGYYAAGDDVHRGFQEFTTAQKTATREILTEFTKVANISFTEKTDDSGQITFANHTMDANLAGYAYYPSTVHSIGGDVWINASISSLLSPSSNGFAYHVIAHEIGHAVGLKHPFDGADTLSAAEDNLDHTIMSYSGRGTPYPNGPSLYDIAALQYLYGANTTTRTGDDTYTVGSPYAIWDAGGYDTLLGTGVGEVIDLRQGMFSGRTSVSFGSEIEAADGGGGADILAGNDLNNVLNGGSGADWFIGSAGDDLVSGGSDTDTIAYTGATLGLVVDLVAGTGSSAEIGNDTIVDVENAVGGSGADLLFGNALANSLSGANGNDLLAGSGGHDRLYGGGGWDKLYGGDGNDRMSGGSGNDILVGGAGNEHGQGDAGADYLYGGDGVDVLSGGTGNDILLGQAGSDYLYGGAGFDYLFGGDETDVLVGNGDTDVLYGERGVDWLYGGAGVDWLLGGDDADMMFGEADPDLLFGGNGNDWLDGGAGNDWFWGGSGADRFVSTGTWGHDVIFDYQDGIDRIDFSHAGAVAGMGNLSIFDSGGYAVISDGINALYLAGVGAHQLSAADFLF